MPFAVNGTTSIAMVTTSGVTGVSVAKVWNPNCVGAVQMHFATFQDALLSIQVHTGQ
jgi:hypothetical protein